MLNVTPPLSPKYCVCVCVVCCHHCHTVHRGNTQSHQLCVLHQLSVVWCHHRRPSLPPLDQTLPVPTYQGSTCCLLSLFLTHCNTAELWRLHLSLVLQVNLLVPVGYLMFWALLLGFSLYSEPVVCGVGLVIMLTGVPVYFLGVHWKEKPKCIYRFIGGLCPGSGGAILMCGS